MSSTMQQIGKRYEIEKLIGGGAVGRVYLGRDTETGEPVAIKELMSEWVARAPDSVEPSAAELAAIDPALARFSACPYRPGSAAPTRPQREAILATAFVTA